MAKDISRELLDIGFTVYEAKAYLALLRQSPLSGYAIARNSGVPRSKIYEVLNNMVKRGDVLVSHGEPVQYTPKLPSELIESRRQKMLRQLDDARVNLEDFQKQRIPTELIWDIRGYDEIITRMMEVIGRAQNYILLQIWEEDFFNIQEALTVAAERGVVVNIVAYGNIDFPPGNVYLHEPGGDEIVREYGGRWAILSIDGNEIVAGIVLMGRESRAAWSSHLGIVMPITEQIKHDLYIAEMLKKHREVLEADFGPALRDLRSKFGPSPTIYNPHHSKDDVAEEK
jgi:sugar-specific transcriptional regulator TrmB